MHYKDTCSSSYFHLFGRFFVYMINNCFNNNFLPESFLSGYITLLCKDKNNLENIKNWRPISLLNFDYKIISKVLTNRLKKVMSSIINIDQMCAIPGRSIFDNCHLLRNIIDYAGQKKIETLIVSLDLEKATAFFSKKKKIDRYCSSRNRCVMQTGMTNVNKNAIACNLL